MDPYTATTEGMQDAEGISVAHRVVLKVTDYI